MIEEAERKKSELEAIKLISGNLIDKSLMIYLEKEKKQLLEKLESSKKKLQDA